MSISVVVPVYNTAPFLEECLESILQQEVGELEIIAINDASQDNSREILEHVAKEEKRLKLINLKQNKGLGPVRNLGIKAAKGKWIAFVDSDDKLRPGALEQLLKTAEEYSSEMVIGSMEKQIDLDNGQHRTEPYATSQYLNFHALNTSLDQCNNLINVPSSCSIVYSRKFLNTKKIRYQRRFQEDHDFVLHALLEARRVSIRGDVPYLVYRKREQQAATKSITSSPWSPEKFSMMVEHLERVVTLLTRRKYHQHIRDIDSLSCTRFSYYLGTFCNHILRSTFHSCSLDSIDHLLDRMSEAFQKSNLDQTGIDKKAESIAQTDPALVAAGFYELSLHLILERRWALLETLVTNRGIKADQAAQLLADKSSNADIRNTLLEYMSNKPAGILKSDVPLPCIVPPKVEEVFIHIGMTKTGSTAIQNFLETNHDELKARGVLYPMTGIFRESRRDSIRTAGHNELITSVWKKNFALLNNFRTEVHESAARKLLISCENLFHADQKVVSALRGIIGEVPVKIIVYLRRQDTWIESYYGESISGGNRKYFHTFARFLEEEKERSLDYLGILENWSEVFGAKNIVVRPYTNEVIEDFCDIIGEQNMFSRFDTPANKSNISPLPKDKLALLREMNKLPFNNRPEGYRKFVHEFVSEFGSDKRDKGVRWLDEDSREELLRHYEHSNQEIAKKYLKGGILFPPCQTDHPANKCGFAPANPVIDPDDLSRSMQLYFKYKDVGPRRNNKGKPKPPVKQTQKHRSFAGKIYAASRGVRGFEQVVNWVSPIHDRFFGVAK